MKADLGLTRVVLAPDKFTGSMTAVQAADAMADGVLDVVPDAEVVRRPVADGGDGTLDALVAAGWTTRPVHVPGPTGQPVRSRIAWDGRTAAVELADCCGRLRLPGGRPAPVTATSRGLGVAIARAVDGGAATVLIGVGGSASTDGGLGLLDALGIRVLDHRGQPITTSTSLVHADRIDGSATIAGLAGTRLVVASDVAAPLLGPAGAARLFGPQKGASTGEIDSLETALARWAQVLAAHGGRQVATVAGAGAAGGVVAGILGALSAICPVELASGADVVLDAIGFDTALAHACAVVTGEGSLDSQTLLGKAPAVVARRARPGCQVFAVAGRVELDGNQCRSLGIDDAISLAELAEPGDDPMRDAQRLARRGTATLVRRSGIGTQGDLPGDP